MSDKALLLWHVQAYVLENMTSKKHRFFLVFTAWCYEERCYEIACRLSVCLSVCLSASVSSIILIIAAFTGRVLWLSAIVVISRHGRENQRTLCNFSIWTVVDEGLYKKAVLWHRNRAMPLQTCTEIYSDSSFWTLGLCFYILIAHRFVAQNSLYRIIERRANNLGQCCSYVLKNYDTVSEIQPCRLPLLYGLAPHPEALSHGHSYAIDLGYFYDV